MKRATLNLLFLVALHGCATRPDLPLPKADTKPVEIAQAETRAAIIEARAAVSSAARRVESAADEATAAAAVAKAISEKGTLAGSAESLALSAQVESLREKLRASTMELRGAELKSSHAEDRAAKAQEEMVALAKVLKEQNDKLIQLSYDLAKSNKERDDAQRESDVLKEENGDLKSAARWAKVRQWLGGIGTVVLGAVAIFLKFAK